MITVAFWVRWESAVRGRWVDELTARCSLPIVSVELHINFFFAATLGSRGFECHS